MLKTIKPFDNQIKICSNKFNVCPLTLDSLNLISCRGDQNARVTALLMRIDHPDMRACRIPVATRVAVHRRIVTTGSTVLSN